MVGDKIHINMKTKIINCNNKKVKEIEVPKRTVKNKGRVYTGTIYPDFSTRHKSTRGIRFVKGEQRAYKRRCIAVDQFKRYMATEITLRLHLGVGMYKDSIRLAVDLIYQLYNNNDMPIVCIPFLRRIKPN